jgi:hypothetical protein
MVHDLPAVVHRDRAEAGQGGARHGPPRPQARPLRPQLVRRVLQDARPEGIHRGDPGGHRLDDHQRDVLLPRATALRDAPRAAAPAEGRPAGPDLERGELDGGGGLLRGPHPRGLRGGAPVAGARDRRVDPGPRHGPAGSVSDRGGQRHPPGPAGAALPQGKPRVHRPVHPPQGVAGPGHLQPGQPRSPAARDRSLRRGLPAQRDDLLRQRDQGGGRAPHRRGHPPRWLPPDRPRRVAGGGR